MLLATAGPGAIPLAAQSPPGRTWELLPPRSTLPEFLAGPRDPVSKASLLYVPANPTEMNDGAEGEVALGVSIPVLALLGSEGDPAGDPESRARWVLGIEASVFARFGFQTTLRPLVNSDWMFAVPLVRHIGPHWVRIRYYHSSSHMGDEYIRLHEDPGVNFSRDALEAIGYFRPGRHWGVYGGGAWAYNVHPEDSGTLWFRGGGEWGTGPIAVRDGWSPYASLDVQVDQDSDYLPRWYAQVGFRTPSVRGSRRIRVALDFLQGPSPLGQFSRLETTQWGLAVLVTL